MKEELERELDFHVFILATIALASLWNLDAGETLSSLVLGACIALSTISAFNTQQLETSIPMRSNSFPLLSLHAPTLHDSTLDRVLSDLLVAHLDPETASHWDIWIKSLVHDVRSDQTPESAVEHLLEAIHLEHLGLLDEDGLLSETRRVFKVSAIDGLFSSNSKFNMITLRRLLAHTRAWQPGLFRLTDRLQDSVIRGDPSSYRGILETRSRPATSVRSRPRESVRDDTQPFRQEPVN